MVEHDPGRVVCLGEALVVLRPDRPGGPGASDLLRCSVGGAEGNVAGALADMGVDTTWVSRLGADPFGDLVERDLRARGVQVVAERDPDRVTGAYLKDSAATGSRMFYYRTGSAASVMDGGLLAEPEVARQLASCHLVHSSGITAGILAPDSDLFARLVEARERHGFLLSIDLNWRPAVWRGRDTRALHELLGAADVLLLGADEARAVLGTSDPAGLRRIVGPRPRLVVKSDSHAATEVAPDGRSTRVPALDVEVVEPVGAGDGFAAGYLAGLLGGYGATQRLRLGHLVAAGVLAEPGDHAHPPAADVRRALVGATAEDWRATRVGPDGIGSPALHAIGGSR
ncbi:MAG: sugar kinase [Marmoricola sp.]